MNRREFSAAVSSLAALATGQPLANARSDDPASRLDRSGDTLPPHALARLGTIRYWNVMGIGAMAISPDGRLIATADFDSTITLWDPSTGQVVRRLARRPVKDNGGFRASPCLAFAPDGSTLAVSRSIERRGMAKDQNFPALGGDNRLAKGVAVLPDDADWGGPRNEGVIERWELAKDQALPTLVGHGEFINGVAYSGDGKTLASTSAQDAVRLWNVAEPDEPNRQVASGGAIVTTAEELIRFDWPEARPMGVGFGPDGKWLASASSTGTIRIWDLPEAKARTQMEAHRSEVLALAFAPDGQTVVSVGGETVCVSIAQTGEMVDRKPLIPPICIAWALSPDGLTLAVRPRWSDRRIEIVDVASGAVAQRIDRMTRTTGVITPYFSADGKTLVIQENCTEIIAEGEDEQTWFALFDPANGAELRRFRPTDGDYPDQLLLAPGGRTLASFGFAGLFLYDPPTGQLRHRFELPDKAHYRMTLQLRAIAFSPDGALLASTDEGGSIRLWDVVVGQEVGFFTAKLARDGTSIAYVPSGKVIATGSSVGRDGQAIVQLWDVASSRELTRFEGHQGGIGALAFSPDGRRLASGSMDTTVIVWDVSAWV